jgi:hypothetical protein
MFPVSGGEWQIESQAGAGLQAIGHPDVATRAAQAGGDFASAQCTLRIERKGSRPQQPVDVIAPGKEVRAYAQFERGNRGDSKPMLGEQLTN